MDVTGNETLCLNTISPYKVYVHLDIQDNSYQNLENYFQNVIKK
jgi:hypothetical protein